MIPRLGAALPPASLWPLSPLTPSLYQARGAQSLGLPGSSPLVAQGNVLLCWKHSVLLDSWAVLSLRSQAIACLSPKLGLMDAH